MSEHKSAATAIKLSHKATGMIGALTGAASFVQSCEGDSESVTEAVREWATKKSELCAYVARLELRIEEFEEATRILSSRADSWGYGDYLVPKSDVGRLRRLVP